MEISAVTKETYFANIGNSRISRRENRKQVSMRTSRSESTISRRLSISRYLVVMVTHPISLRRRSSSWTSMLGIISNALQEMIYMVKTGETS
jgi:hypothetical protein